MLKRLAIVLAIVGLFLFTWVPMSFSDENEIEALKKEIHALQEKIKILEQKQEQTQTKVISLEEREPKGEFVEAIKEKVELGGRIEFNYVDVHDPNSGDFDAQYPQSRFYLDKVRLKVKAKPEDDIVAKIKIDYEAEDEKIKVDEGYITFKELPFKGELSLGLKDKFIASGAADEWITEIDPLARTAFWKYPDLGLQYKGNIKQFYWYLSLTNGVKFDTKNIGNDRGKSLTGSMYSNRILSDTTLHTDLNDNKQIGFGLGSELSLGRGGIVDILGFSYFSKLNATDFTTYLKKATIFPNFPSDNTNDKQRRYGFNLSYIKGNWDNFIQGLWAQDSFLRRNTWLIQTSYKIDTDMRYLKAIQPLYRFDYYNVKWPHSLNYPLTWTRKAHVLGLINYLRENILLKIEYMINEEDTGANEPDNNELLVQLRYEF